MVRLAFMILSALSLSLPLAQGAGDETGTTTQPGPKKPLVLHFQIYDPIEDPAQTEKFEQRIKSVSGKFDRLVVVAIDSPGGDPMLVARIIQAIRSANVKKIAYVDRGRFGGVYGPCCGIPLVCDRVIVNPNAKIGTKCNASPLAMDQCKRLPCSDIHPLMMDYWLKGVRMNDMVFANYTNIKRSQAIASEGCLFRIGPEISDGNEQPHAKGEVAEKSVCYSAIDAKAKGLADKITDDIYPIIEESIGTKDYLDSKLPLTSSLGKNFFFTERYLKQLAKPKREMSVYRVGADLGYWRDKRVAAGALNNVIRTCPIIEKVMDKDLRSGLREAPECPSIDTIKEGWACIALTKMIYNYDGHIANIREQLAAEARERAERRKAEAARGSNSSQGPGGGSSIRTYRRSR